MNEQAASEAPADAEAAAEGNVSSRLSAAALKKELEEREKNMQAGAPDGGVTDQWRVYQHVVTQLQTGSPLRLMVQASAGTGSLADLFVHWSIVLAGSYFHISFITFDCARRGKSYLLSTIYLWRGGCIV